MQSQKQWGDIPVTDVRDGVALLRRTNLTTLGALDAMAEASGLPRRGIEAWFYDEGPRRTLFDRIRRFRRGLADLLMDKAAKLRRDADALERKAAEMRRKDNGSPEHDFPDLVASRDGADAGPRRAMDRG